MVSQWKHVPGIQNPADMLSRGVSVQDFISCSVWTKGPEFLSMNEQHWPKQFCVSGIPSSDGEIRDKVLVTKEKMLCESVERIINSSSSFVKIKFRVAVFHKFLEYLKCKTVKCITVSVNDLSRCEIVLFRYLQRVHFSDIYTILAAGGKLPKRHALVKLSPFLDVVGVMRVGGRLCAAPVAINTRHPIMLPRNTHISTLLVEDFHRNLGHLGREAVLAHVRLRFHIVNGNSLIKEIVRKCIICRKVLGKPSEQLMSSLPLDRINPNSPPFANTGTDYFGPFFVARGRGRTRDKRYGVIFSCLVSRCVHIEIAHSLDTDSFINCIRRFICRRGPVLVIRSDNGTNLVAGDKELKAALKHWNESQIDDKCKVMGIDWKFNPPTASNFGGVYEREIRTIRKTLNSLLLEFDNQVTLTDEFLLTLMCEVENTLNSRPLTAVSTDVDDLEALTPNHIFKLHTSLEFPPGLFDENDLYSSKRWRQVQFLSDVFWRRWRQEYLPLPFGRQKWVTERCSHSVGYFVLVG